MKLYTHKWGFNPRRLDIFIKYKGLDLPTVYLDFEKKEQFSPDFLAINDEGTVPTLYVEEGVALTETIAIMTYLDSIFPKKSLFGDEPLQCAQVYNWDNYIIFSGQLAAVDIIRNSLEYFKDRALSGQVNLQQLPELAARGHKRVDYFLKCMNKRVGNKDYLVGEHLSLADIDLFATIEFITIRVGKALPEGLVALEDYSKRIKKELVVTPLPNDYPKK